MTPPTPEQHAEALRTIIDGYESASHHITHHLQPEFAALAKGDRLSWHWSEEYDQAVAANRLATWWHGIGFDEYVEDARKSLDALLARLADAEQRAEEWKREAELSKWPKEAAAEYHRMKVELPAAEARVKELEAALAEIARERFGQMPDGKTPSEFARAALAAVSDAPPKAREKLEAMKARHRAKTNPGLRQP